MKLSDKQYLFMKILDKTGHVYGKLTVSGHASSYTVESDRISVTLNPKQFNELHQYITVIGGWGVNDAGRELMREYDEQ